MLAVHSFCTVIWVGGGLVLWSVRVCLFFLGVEVVVLTVLMVFVNGVRLKYAVCHDVWDVIDSWPAFQRCCSSLQSWGCPFSFHCPSYFEVRWMSAIRF